MLNDQREVVGRKGAGQKRPTTDPEIRMPEQLA
jgi:hypothetical protein